MILQMNIALPFNCYAIALRFPITMQGNNKENFIDFDENFDPAKYFTELTNGKKSNNFAKKRGTAVIFLHSTGR